jgi:prepilin-type N-terminal cleavage/methylation domain-containing protein
VTARLRRLRADDGFTLTELMVTIVLVSVLMAFVLATMTRLYGTVTDNDVRTQSLNTASTAMDAITRQIRTAISVEEAGGGVQYAEATPSRVTVYTLSGTDAKKVTFTVDAQGRLVQDTVLPDAADCDSKCTYTKNAATTRVLATSVRNQAALFEYRLADTTWVATAADFDTRAKIRAVRVRLEVLTNGNRKVAPVSLDNTVYPFNDR